MSVCVVDSSCLLTCSWISDANFLSRDAAYSTYLALIFWIWSCTDNELIVIDVYIVRSSNVKNRLCPWSLNSFSCYISHIVRLVGSWLLFLVLHDDLFYLLIVDWELLFIAILNLNYRFCETYHKDFRLVLVGMLNSSLCNFFLSIFKFFLRGFLLLYFNLTVHHHVFSACCVIGAKVPWHRMSHLLLVLAIVFFSLFNRTLLWHILNVIWLACNLVLKFA